MKKKLPKSIRKYLRQKKARIRREILDIVEQKELISQLYSKFLSNGISAEINSEIKNKKTKTKITNQKVK